MCSRGTMVVTLSTRTPARMLFGLRQERLYECTELLRALHHLGVLRVGQDRETAVGKEVEHLGSMVEADEVPVTDDQERRCRDRLDLLVGPAGPIVNDRLHALQEREEVVGVWRDGVIRRLPSGELLFRREAGIVLLRCGDFGVVAVRADV